MISSGQVTSMTQGDAQLTSANGDVANLAPEPKFLGYGPRPARIGFFDGSLKYTLKGFAVYELVIGLFGIFNILVYHQLGEILLQVESFAYMGVIFGLATCLWFTAANQSLKWGYSSLGFLAGVFVMNIIDTVVSAIPPDSVVKRYTTYFKRMHERASAWAKETGNDPININLSNGLPMMQFYFIVKGILNVFLYLLILYFIWSFIVRVKRGENLLLTSGPRDLPTSVPDPVAPQPNSQTQLSLRQPMAFSHTQPFNLDEVPDSQPPMQ